MGEKMLFWLIVGAVIIITIVIVVVLVVIFTVGSSSKSSSTAVDSIIVASSIDFGSGSPPVSELLVGEDVPQYYFDLGIVDLWQQGFIGTGINVLVIDSGVNNQHPDLLREKTVNENYDEDMHGTHVSGIIGGAFNGVGLAGVAPSCNLWMWDMGDGNVDNILPAFDWAVQHGIQVINMSFGTDVDIPEFHQKILLAYNAGIYLVAAAGNSASSNIIYPVAYPEVISVASLADDGSLSQFSNYNPDIIDVAMYGENILSDNARYTGVNNLLVSMSGTSMATPFVTGLCAILLQKILKAGDPPPHLQDMIHDLRQHLPPLPVIH